MHGHAESNFLSVTKSFVRKKMMVIGVPMTVINYM